MILIIMTISFIAMIALIICISCIYLPRDEDPEKEDELQIEYLKVWKEERERMKELSLYY